MKIKLLILSSFLFIGCAERPKETIRTSVDKYIVVKIKPPKHFYLDLKRVKDNVLIEDVYVSKHCNDICIKEGDTLSLTFGEYKRGDYIWQSFDTYEIENLACGCY